MDVMALMAWMAIIALIDAMAEITRISYNADAA